MKRLFVFRSGLTQLSSSAHVLMAAAVVCLPVELRASAQPRMPHDAADQVAQFDAASIRRNNTGSTGVEGSGRIAIQTSPGVLTMRNVTLMSCLRWAYDVHDYQITGPGWLGSERFDIVAKAGEAVGDTQLKAMLRALLDERFKIVLHRDLRELPVFALTVSRNGHGLKPGDVNGPRETVPRSGGITYKNVSMTELATILSVLPPIGRPVLDKTGLAGIFDVPLVLVDATVDGGGSAGDLKRAARDQGPAMFMDALERAGLHLQPEKASIEFLVVDRAEKVPTED